MKTNFKYFTLLIAALLVVGFASCSSDDDATKGVEVTATKSVVLKLSNGPTVLSEGESQGADTNDTPVVFTNGIIYFTSEVGAIMKHFTISAAATNVNDATDPGTNINLGELTGASGVTFNSLPGNITDVYIVGNYPTDSPTPLPTSGPISGVRNHVLKVENQVDFKYVNLYGTSALTAPTSPATLYKATVNLAPTVARVELDELKGHTNFKSFSVEGLFVDNYYSQAAVNGVVNDDFLKNNESASKTGDVVFKNGTSGYYPATLTPSIYDWYTTDKPMYSTVATAVSSEPLAKPADGKVWGYNLFANNSVAPRIVIRLNSAIAKDGTEVTFADPQFLTIKSFKNASGTITTIQPGHIYKISNLLFKGTDLKPAPYMDPIEVEVKVTLATWTVEKVQAEL